MTSTRSNGSHVAVLVVWVVSLLLWLDDDDDDEEDDDRGTYPAYVGQAGSRKTTDLCALVWWLLTEACGRFLLDVRETLVEDAAVEDMVLMARRRRGVVAQPATGRRTAIRCSSGGGHSGFDTRAGCDTLQYSTVQYGLKRRGSSWHWNHFSQQT